MALNTLRVRKIIKPGRYADGGGLYLRVRKSGARDWAFRYMVRGSAHEMALGPERDTLLADARDKARECRRLLASGKDPIAARKDKEAEEDAKAHAMAFRDVAELFIVAHQVGWRNAKHRQQWRTTLASYVLPIMGAKPVAEIETGDVMKTLEPIWLQKPETASRVRGRIEAILDYAKAREWRGGENPARWRGHLANLLPARGKIARVKHHAALPWREIGSFMAELRGREGMAARALEFAILTAARSGEVLGMRWNEIGLGAAVWTVPAERMKAGREHRVPLSAQATAILDEMRLLRREDDGLVFPSNRGKPLSDMSMAMLLRRMGRGDLTVHGFRSTFRDWCAEATNYPRDVAEAALAHVNADKTEAAYQRGDILARRALLMTAWASFCDRPATESEVIPLARSA